MIEIRSTYNKSYANQNIKRQQNVTFQGGLSVVKSLEKNEIIQEAVANCAEKTVKPVKNLINKNKEAVTAFFSKHSEIGEGAGIFFDFIGKAAIIPIVMIFNPFSKEDKDSKTYSALKHPVGASIQAVMEVSILMQGTRYIDKLAKQGKLGAKYAVSKLTGENLEKATSRLNFFKNRACWVAAISMTPALCAIENWAHPKLMKIISPKTAERKNTSKNGGHKA
ncbi:MAG: hypothetical protein PHV68_03970 [Candidatus Gastranaerophilales bacterium]|nr:hypothetical protein [Candidatus Gastranaerophilales bacterium]